MNAPSISIIIPALNEMENIGPCIKACRRERNIEVIVVDGGSTDRTQEIARSSGARVVSAKSSRGVQINAGARAASSDVLLFLHADTLLPKGYLYEIRRILKESPGAVGAFTLSIDGHGAAFRIIEFLVHLRSQYLKVVYGDQAIFLSRKTFFELGGFPRQPLMEDLEFIRRARRCRPVVVSSRRVITSGRRWKSIGPFRTTIVNQCLVLAYLMGISPERLASIYYEKKH